MRDYNVKDLLSPVKIGGKNPFRSLEEELWSNIPLWLPSGAISLDYAIGGYRPGFKGGIPVGRLVEIYGPESCGKSTLLDHIMKAALEREFIAILGDKEHAHDERRMKEIGIDPTNLVFIETSKEDTDQRRVKGGIVESEDFTLEDFMETGEASFKAIRQRDESIPILMALDSLAVTPTRVQADIGLNEDMSMKDRLDKSTVLSDRLPNFCTLITKNNGVLIFVNQLRSRPGVTFGDSDYSPGGNTVKFLASLRIKLEESTPIKPDEDPIRTHRGSSPVGIRIRFKIVKNKVAPPLRKGTFPIMFDDRGIFKELCFADMLDDLEAEKWDKRFEKSGSWYSWNEERIGHGKKDLVKTLYERPELMEELERELFLTVPQKENDSEPEEENGKKKKGKK